MLQFSELVILEIENVSVVSVHVCARLCTALLYPIAPQQCKRKSPQHIFGVACLVRPSSPHARRPLCCPAAYFEHRAHVHFTVLYCPVGVSNEEEKIIKFPLCSVQVLPLPAAGVSPKCGRTRKIYILHRREMGFSPVLSIHFNSVIHTNFIAGLGNNNSNDLLCEIAGARQAQTRSQPTTTSVDA